MSIQRIPRGFLYAGLILVILAMIPPALIARFRATNSRIPRIHLMQDMDVQHRFEAQEPNPIFRDRRGMRPIVAGTVAQGELLEDDHYYRGVIVEGESEQWATSFPSQVALDMNLMERGRDRYDIFCHVCHGRAGHGDGMINERALRLMEAGTNGTTWVPALSLHDQRVLDMPVGQLYNVITHGARTMPPYGSQIPVADRWAIVAYIKALQRSQNAEVQSVSAGGVEEMNTP